MSKKLFTILGVSSLLAAAFSFSAFAETINSVSFAAGCDTEANITSGEILSPVFVVNDTNAEYELSSYSDVTSSESYKTARTYELVFNANDGFEFPAASSITVQGKGIEEITKKTVDADTTLTVRVKAYPYYAWEAPAISDSSDITKKVSWSRPSGTTSEYLITWVNQSGDTKYVHSTTSSASVSLTSYNKEYKGTKTDEYSDSYVEGVAVRIKGAAGSNTHTAPSEWSIIGSINTEDFEFDSYETWGELFEGVSAVSGSGKSSSSTASGSATAGPGSSVLNGWQNLNGTWYFYENGTSHKGWYLDGNLWYYLDPTTGQMMTGWIIYNEHKYYLNPNVGGPQGSMVTGAVTIDGTAYNFAATGELQ